MEGVKSRTWLARACLPSGRLAFFLPRIYTDLHEPQRSGACLPAGRLDEVNLREQMDVKSRAGLAKARFSFSTDGTDYTDGGCEVEGVKWKAWTR